MNSRSTTGARLRTTRAHLPYLVPRSKAGRWLDYARRLPIFPLMILLVVLVAAIFAPLLAPYEEGFSDLASSLRPPAWLEGGSSDFLLGTDYLGHDILSRVIYGARVSLLVGFSAVALAGTVGTILGLISAYYGRWIDAIVMRWVDMQMSVPSILLALILSAVIGPGLGTVITVIMIVYWTYYARLVRSEVLSVKARDYVALARVVGCGNGRILFRHILPNIINSIVVLATVQLGAVIIFEASLSFLGLGVQPPTAAWGSMLADGRKYVSMAWWLSVFPGLAIMLTVLSMNLFGDWLRDRWDPKRRQL